MRVGIDSELRSRSISRYFLRSGLWTLGLWDRRGWTIRLADDESDVSLAMDLEWTSLSAFFAFLGAKEERSTRKDAVLELLIGLGHGLREAWSS